jgi:hypothetical protein
MANIDKLIIQAQNVIETLNEKLRKIDEIHRDIQSGNELNKRKSGELEKQFKDIVNLSYDYTNALGKATNTYLEVNNKLLEQNLKDLQSNSRNLGEKINKLGEEVTKIEVIDISKHYVNLQKTLSDLKSEFNLLNASTAKQEAVITNILKNTENSNNYLEAGLNSVHKEMNRIKDDFSGKVALLGSKFETFAADIAKVEKEVGLIKTINIVTFAFAVAILIFLAVKL